MADIGGRGGGGGGGGGAPPSDLINKMINTLFISETNYSVTTSHVIFIVLESVMASKRVHSGSESILNYFSKKAKGIYAYRNRAPVMTSPTRSRYLIS